jgi:hypothetical protein
MHRTITECARLLWKDVYLFASNGASIERQKNMRQIENLISEGILQGVRTMLPVKSILREYLATEESDAEIDVEDEEEEEEPVEKEEPVTKEPVTKEPVTKEPDTKEPDTKEPDTKEPETKEPAAKEENEPIKVPTRPSTPVGTPKLRPTTPSPIIDELPATEDIGPKTTNTPPSIILDLSPRMNSIVTTPSSFDKTKDDKPINEIEDMDFDEIPFDLPVEEPVSKKEDEEEIEFEEL